MVTFTIIEQLIKEADPYKIGVFNGNSLWLADDAVIIAKDEESLLKALKVFEEAGKRNGLELSEEKTKIMRIRGTGEEKKIRKFKIEKKTKYLGIQLGGKGRDTFGAENKIWIQKAEKKAYELMREIKISCDMVVVGKAV